MKYNDIKYKHSFHTWNETRTKTKQTNKQNSKFRATAQNNEAAGESHYFRKCKTRKQALPPRFNCCSAEAWHRFKCGNPRGRGGTCSGWSEGDQPGVMGLEPTNKKPQPILRKIFPPQKRPLRLPGERLEDSQPESFGNRFYKALKGIPGDGLAMTEEEASWPSGSFPAPTPMIPGSFCCFQLTGASVVVARLLWSSSLSVLGPGWNYWGALAEASRLQPRLPCKQLHQEDSRRHTSGSAASSGTHQSGPPSHLHIWPAENWPLCHLQMRFAPRSQDN